MPRTANKPSPFTVTDIDALEAAYPRAVKKVVRSGEVALLLKHGVVVPGVTATNASEAQDTAAGSAE